MLVRPRMVVLRLLGVRGTDDMPGRPYTGRDNTTPSVVSYTKDHEHDTLSQGGTLIIVHPSKIRVEKGAKKGAFAMGVQRNRHLLWAVVQVTPQTDHGYVPRSP